jgi:hypothetical protein
MPYDNFYEKPGMKFERQCGANPTQDCQPVSGVNRQSIQPAKQDATLAMRLPPMPAGGLPLAGP